MIIRCINSLFPSTALVTAYPSLSKCHLYAETNSKSSASTIANCPLVRGTNLVFSFMSGLLRLVLTNAPVLTPQKARGVLTSFILANLTPESIAWRAL